MPDAEETGQVWPVVPLAALPITDATIDETARDFILRATAARAAGARPFYSTSANGQVIALCHHDREFDAMLRQADQIHADGMSLVIFSRKFCPKALRERVATTDLVHAVAKRAEETGSRFYFLGGSEEVNRAAVEEMQRLYPRLIFAGRRNGYFSRAEEEAILADIAASGTDILWVGFGIPLEQRFVSRNLDRLSGIAVIKTCGGLFRFSRRQEQPGAAMDAGYGAGMALPGHARAEAAWKTLPADQSYRHIFAAEVSLRSFGTRPLDHRDKQLPREE